MDKKYRSISFKIWFSIVRVVLIIGLVLPILNVTVVRNFKSEFIYDQLEYAAEDKLSKYKNNEIIEPDEIFHYVIITDNDSYTIMKNRLIKNTSNTESIINAISSKVVSNIDDQTTLKGKIDKFDEVHYYYAVAMEQNQIMIFTKNIEKEHDTLYNLLGAFIIVTIIILIISITTSKNVTKPIRLLENFSKEISKRNWHAQLPELNNDELGQLAKTMNETKFELERSELRDREFIQATSHDLKTPVMIIKGYAQAIADDIHINNVENATHIILTETIRLENKIEKLLQVNALDYTLHDNHMHEEIHIDRILHRVIEELRVLRQDLHWDIKLTPYVIQGNPEGIRIAFENIIDNQMRYAKESITIMITDHMITIANDGPQFSLNTDELFDQYHKGNQGNFGLGLSITKRIITAHHGEIKAENTSDGVLFSIKIPSI